MSTGELLYRADLAAVHDRAFGFQADNRATGILDLLGPIRERNGLVLEIGCGSGLLTRHLLDAGHRVIATDASPAMLDIARPKIPKPKRSASSSCQPIPCHPRTPSWVSVTR